MDFLGLFDGLFTMFSAIRSGKNVDEPETKKVDKSRQSKKQVKIPEHDEIIRARKREMQRQRKREALNKEREYERGRG